MNHLIGKCFVNYFHIIDHFDKYEDYKKDESLFESFRSYSVQHLAHFNEIVVSDLENHSIGYGLKAVKKTKIEDLMGERVEFYKRVRNLTFSKIKDLTLISENNQKFENSAYHYFFDIHCWVKISYNFDYKKDIIEITNIFIGDLNSQEEYYPNLFSRFVGIL